ncbi:MAG: hypothetical protein WBS54_02135 [Acidobacteriota bacterium]
MAGDSSLTQRRILAFWAPLAGTWLMMSVEGPFLAAVIARLPAPTLNLAAYGVAYAVALLVESPILLVMSTSTALAEDWASYLKLRNFVFSLNAALTAIMALSLWPPLFERVAGGLMGLPENLVGLTHLACLLLLPWPASIGYRRFYQGILVRNGLARRVAYGTILRVGSMGGVALLLSLGWHASGALVGAASLSAGVVVEAVSSRLMARRPLRAMKGTASVGAGPEPLSYRYIWHFYTPLALTSILSMGVNPLVTFFMPSSKLGIESLAVLPVVNALVFIFRSLGLAFQDVGIALAGPQREEYRPLRRFASALAVAAAGGLAVIAFTPLLGLWLQGLSGLSPALASVAVVPTRIMAVMPAFSVLLSFQHGMLVSARNTRPVSLATALEVASIALALFIGIRIAGLVGATAAAGALLFGRIAAVLFLMPSFRRATAPGRLLSSRRSTS